jgi:predicted TPR repeat methyltransferase
VRCTTETERHASIPAMPGRDEWNEIAAADADELRERILTGYKSGKPFTPYVPTISLPASIESVLDFGCGLGRNFPYLKTIATRVEGFDLPLMIERCRALGAEQGSRLSSDWMDVGTRRYDLVFASLVLQHIETDECRRYLADFAGLAPCVYLLTRTRTDFDAVMLELVAESRRYHTSTCRVVDHDPETHQLRIIADRTFDAARESPDDVHYEVLLRSCIP